jgi:hypothetical protein
MRALEQTDPEAARRVFDQHRVLYPDLGPAPWNACIASIGQELDAERQRDAP